MGAPDRNREKFGVLGRIADGVDEVRAFTRDGAWASGLHQREGRIPEPFVMRADSGKPSRLAVPGGVRLDVAGFVEEGAR